MCYLTSTLFQCYFLSLKSILREEALNDSVMRNNILIDCEYFVVLLCYMFDPLVLEWPESKFEYMKIALLWSHFSNYQPIATSLSTLTGYNHCPWCLKSWMRVWDGPTINPYWNFNCKGKVQSCSMTSESLICSIHWPALFFALEFIDNHS